MKTTYNYDTRQIKRDWVFVRFGTPCKLSGLPCLAGNNRCREKCKHYGGIYQYCIRCDHPEMKEGKNVPLSDYYEKLEEEALKHYYD